jgi:hypothetical protein
VAVVVDEGQLWLRDTWVPVAMAAGLERIAVVIAHRGLGKIASDEIIGRLGKTTFVTKTFESPEEALNWIGLLNHQAQPA